MSLPAPFYQDAFVTLYHGDTYALLPHLEATVIITDPPYGTGWVKGGHGVGEFVAAGDRPDWDRWNPAWLDLVRDRVEAVATFCPQQHLPDLWRRLGDVRLRYYVKSNPRPPLGSDAPSVEPIVCWPSIRGTPAQQHLEAYNGDATFHACQKPLSVMRWLVEGMTRPSDTIGEPFLGSGSTCIAAKLLNRRTWGIERDLPTITTAAERIAGTIAPASQTFLSLQ